MPPEIDLDDFDYALSPDRIAQHPAAERDAARLLVLDRGTGERSHSRIRELPRWLRAGDLIVVNATRVVPARLRGRKDSGGAAEALLLGPRAGGEGQFRALLKTRGQPRPGQKFRFVRGHEGLDAELLERSSDGEVVLAFEPGADPYALGETPLPPYIRRDAPEDEDAERYQTTYARVPGSVAAPTAGLHLSERLLAELDASGIARAEVVLHVGPGTFRPLRPGDLASGRLGAESIELSEENAARIAQTRARGGRVVAVGTTSVRVLEACAEAGGGVRPTRGETDLFITPGHAFRAVDALLTNFHLPRSSLLLLAAAFAGRDALLDAYAEAQREDYRFYSYGDAMLIL
jgi:S-adenosylmethionine:tRNA ribosyltransferase-isomerase